MDITTVTTVSEDAGTLVHLKDVAGELLYDGEGDAKTPVTIRVAGTYSERYRRAQKRLKDRNLRGARRGEEFGADTLDAGTIELEAACIVEWTFTAGGQPFPITANNWTALVAKQPQWQEQVSAAMTDHARFFASSSPG
jgi:hypothetical protein